jgi:hypothetical protein
MQIKHPQEHQDRKLKPYSCPKTWEISRGVLLTENGGCNDTTHSAESKNYGNVDCTLGLRDDVVVSLESMSEEKTSASE